MTKRIKSFLFGLLALLLALCVVSCADEVKNVKTEPTRKDVLLDYAVFQDYKMTEEEVENSLVDFLTSGNESKGLNPSSFTIKKINDSTVTFDGKCASKALTSTEQDDILFSVYEVENQKEGKTGFAITSDDKRVGEVLCYVEEGEFSTDISDNPGMTIFAVCLNDYINQTQDIWDEITDEDIAALKEEYGITDEDIENAKLECMNSKATTTYSPWKTVRGSKTKMLLKTNWGQGYPYNAGVAAVKGDYYPTGCTITATAQLMAYWEKPKSYQSNSLKTLKSKWKALSNWDGVYDWKSMKNDNYNPQIGALMYEIGNEVGADYKKSGTGAWPEDAVAFLKRRNYSYAGTGLFASIVSNSSSDIPNSIDNNRPVMIAGYATQRCVFKILWWE